MTIVALVLCLFVASIGAVGVFSPPRLLAFARRFQSRAGLATAAALRLVMGAAFYLAAPDSRAPDVIRFLGVFIFLAGLATPFFGVERFRRILDRFAALGSAFLRGWAACTLGIGLLLAYLVCP